MMGPVLNGLISKEMGNKMTEEDKLKLIFSPSLSTKDEITDISGRGVGMDAVKKERERLGGSIRIESLLGKGTTFIFKIPTNLS